MSRKQRQRRPAVGYNDSIDLLKSIHGLTLALDYRFGVYTDTTLTAPAAIGQTVKGWRDRSGNGYHATEATNPPTLAADGLTFDGSNDVLRVARMPGAFSAGYSSFIVANSADGVPPAMQFILGTLKTGPSRAYFYNSTNTTGTLRTGVFENGVNPDVFVTTLPNGQTVDFILSTTATPGGNLVGYYNGGGATSTSLAALTWANIADPVTEAPYIGARNQGGVANNFFVGTIKSIIIYNRPLSTAELLVVHRYLGAKYAITVP